MKEEIYKTPESNLTNEGNQTPPFGKKLRGSIIGILSIWIYFGLNKVVGQFSQTFEAFGAKLPALTIIGIKSTVIYKILGVLSSILFILWIISIAAEIKQKLVYKLIKINFFTAMVILLVVIFGLYLPIFQLSEIV